MARISYIQRDNVRFVIVQQSACIVWFL